MTETQIIHVIWHVKTCNKIYKISFNDIDECPPKVTVTISTNESLSWFAKLLGKKEKTFDYETETADVVNVLNAILESED